MSILRIGLIGAGTNTRDKHIPGFRTLVDVEIAGVANRSEASSNAVAEAHGIAKVYDDWMELIEDPGIDAVCIGTWPYTHEVMSVAALEAGKHVLCEARMAANIDDALAMYTAHLQAPDLVAQLVPAPFTLNADAQIISLLAEGAIGELITVDILAEIPSWSEAAWRTLSAFSGRNTLTLGIWYEVLCRWLGPAKNVTAHSRLMHPFREVDGQIRAVDIPDHMELIGQMQMGATYHMRFSSATAHTRNEANLLGTKGTLSWKNGEIHLHRHGESHPEIIEPNGLGWHVEADFVHAIRSGESVRHTSFHDGLRYMAFTEAAISSAASGQCQAVEIY